MDVTKIKIGRETYAVRDDTARTTISPIQEELIRNIMIYGIADITNKTQEELAQMAANMQQYGIPDITGISQDQLNQMFENMQKYGIANVDGLTQELKDALEAAHNATRILETDPKFTTWKNLLTVDADGILMLI